MERIAWWEEALVADVVRYDARAVSEQPRIVWRVSEHHVWALFFAILDVIITV